MYLVKSRMFSFFGFSAPPCAPPLPPPPPLPPRWSPRPPLPPRKLPRSDIHSLGPEIMIGRKRSRLMWLRRGSEARSRWCGSGRVRQMPGVCLVERVKHGGWGGTSGGTGTGGVILLAFALARLTTAGSHHFPSLPCLHPSSSFSSDVSSRTHRPMLPSGSLLSTFR